MPSVRSFGMVAVMAGALALPAIGLADDTMPPAGARGEMLMWIKDADSKLNQLAEAMPEGKYSWRPGKGVRSVGEVFMHVAAANFGIPGYMGATPPAGFDFATYEKSMSKKADIQKALKDSFAHLEQSLVSATDEDMEKPVEIFGLKTTHRGGYMLLMSHVHEHLGQSIAYARTNNVVPPWSAKQAEMKDSGDKATKK